VAVCLAFEALGRVTLGRLNGLFGVVRRFG
jgi:hypothetical protein